MLQEMNVTLFNAVNRGCASPFLDVVMRGINLLGDGTVLVALAAVLFLAKKRKAKAAGLLLLAGLALSYYLVDFLKNWFAVPRPHVTLCGVQVLERAGGYAFPSGHTANAFLAATLLTWAFGRPFIFFPLALLAGIARIYVGVHYPFDVAGGAIVGTAVGCSLLYLWRRAACPAETTH